jgi:hypothetical protein
MIGPGKYDAVADAKGCHDHIKLRFLQYVTKETRPWWEAQRENGAVIL